jgi:hypothetical protein
MSWDAVAGDMLPRITRSLTQFNYAQAHSSTGSSRTREGYLHYLAEFNGRFDGRSFDN